MFKKTRKRNRPRRQFLFIPVENPSILRLRFGFTREKAFSFLSFFPGGAARAVCLTLLQADGPTFWGPESYAIELRLPSSCANFSIHRSFFGAVPSELLPAAPFPFRKCCRLSRGSFVNGMIPGAHSKSKATMESEGKP